jgi:hypothetical protein
MQQAGKADENQIERHDDIEQAWHDKDKNAGQQGNDRLDGGDTDDHRESLMLEKDVFWWCDGDTAPVIKRIALPRDLYSILPFAQ